MKTIATVIAAATLLVATQANATETGAAAALANAAPQTASTTTTPDAGIVKVGRRGGGFRRFGGGARRFGGGARRFGGRFRGFKHFKRFRGPRNCRAAFCAPHWKGHRKFKRHFKFGHRPIFVGKGCFYFKKKWRLTGSRYWKLRYFKCRGWH